MDEDDAKSIFRYFRYMIQRATEKVRLWRDTGITPSFSATQRGILFEMHLCIFNSCCQTHGECHSYILSDPVVNAYLDEDPESARITTAALLELLSDNLQENRRTLNMIYDKLIYLGMIQLPTHLYDIVPHMLTTNSDSLAGLFRERWFADVARRGVTPTSRQLQGIEWTASLIQHSVAFAYETYKDEMYARNGTEVF